MRALVLAVLVCSIVALLLVAGCTFNLKNADGSLNKSFSTNPGTGTGTTTVPTTITRTITSTVTSTGEGTDSGTGSGIGDSSSGGGKSRGSGSGSGGSLVPDARYMKAYFTVDCTRTLVDDEPSYTDTWTARLKGDAPFMVLRNWNREPAISAPQEFASGPEGGEAKPNLHAEWIRTCKKPDCKPCHFVYEGPTGIGVSIQHDPKDAPADWKAMLSGIGTRTHESVSDGTMDQYTTNQESACLITDLHFMTESLYFQSDRCFDIQYAPATGYMKPFTFGDGSMITYTSSDPEASLASTAVFHFSG